MTTKIAMTFASVTTFHDNGKPHSLTKYDSGNDNSDSDSAIKHSLELEKVNAQHRVADNSVELEEGGMKLSEAIEAYKKWRDKSKPVGSKSRGLSNKVAQSRYSNFSILLLVLGDKDVKTISKSDVRKTMTVIENMPRRNVKPYCQNKDLSVWVEAASKRQIPDEDLISSKSVKEAFKDYQSLFSTFLVNNEFILDASPTTGLKITSQSRSYAPFSLEQMNSIVSYWRGQQDTDYKWIILLAAYTGARRGDIFNLKLSSIKFDDSCNRHYLFIEEGKTDAARRKIPIHQELVNMGFLTFLEQKSAGHSLEFKLFRAFKTDCYITTRFAASLESLSIDKLSDEKRRRSFHSLRHAMITESMKYNEMHLVQRVVGHELSEAGITKKYTGEFELKNYLGVIDCLDWR
ncbi:tyrosine-type recombinase/integrase [Shewanella gelidimarina]|uniref:tyrosine-type recombinase/integrase n=1 Tax=Shewanella gelidimarina TaxID=56813 RepID=UPI00200ECDE4|nr:tyrosine-type recombinase/integrase [Shewanella gelidimarina]MCL1059662.1 tyrosine-type recombinase/integrase [Shewanella gelidimarina]